MAVAASPQRAEIKETSAPAALRPASSFYIPSLDGIRALAVLWVFAAHAGLSEWGIPGSLGVTVFFFLSGYLITTLLRMEIESRGRIELKAFYIRRTLRIFPPMYLVLILASALTAMQLLEGSLQIEAVLTQALHLTNYYIIQAGWWDGRAPGTWVYWSLAVEEHFYLLFPLFYLALHRLLPSRRHQMLALLGICLAILAWRIFLVLGLDAIRDRTYIATDTRADSILFGCMLAIYGNPVLDREDLLSRRWIAWGLPLSVVALIASAAIRQPQFQETLRYTIQGLALFPLFIVAIRHPEWGICRLLNLSWIRVIGVLSYSIYLLHTTVLFGIQQWTSWHPALQGGLALGFCLVAAKLINVYVERPCMNLRRHLLRQETRARGGGESTSQAGAQEAGSPGAPPEQVDPDTRWIPART